MRLPLPIIIFVALIVMMAALGIPIAVLLTKGTTNTVDESKTYQEDQKTTEPQTNMHACVIHVTFPLRTPTSVLTPFKESYMNQIMRVGKTLWKTDENCVSIPPANAEIRPRSRRSYRRHTSYSLPLRVESVYPEAVGSHRTIRPD